MFYKLKNKYTSFLSGVFKRNLYMNTTINVTDNNHIEIENCKRIMEYNDVYIRLRTANNIVSVWGKNLSVSDYNTDGIIIDGKITSIEFE